jgi:hypothetical protein
VRTYKLAAGQRRKGLMREILEFDGDAPPVVILFVPNEYAMEIRDALARVYRDGREDHEMERQEVPADPGPAQVTVTHTDFSTLLAAAAILASLPAAPAADPVRSRLADLLARYDVHVEVT